MVDLIREIAAERGRRLDVLLLVVAVLLALALRVPSLGAPLGIDEGGMALVGGQWLDLLRSGDGGGETLYGDLWLDRPPLLVLAYGIADQVGGAAGVRMLGAAASALVVACVAMIARRVGGRRAMIAAATISACTLSSPVLRGDMTYGELLAAAPVAASVLLLVVVSTGSMRRGWPAGAARVTMVAAAGLLAACGPLVKQSAIDGAAAAALWLAWRAGLAWRDRDGRERLRTVASDAGAWLAGALVPASATLAWASTTPGGVRDVLYALAGFRIDLVAALGEQSTPPATRALQLVPALAGSGLVVVLLLVPTGLLAARSPGRGTAIAMLLGGWLAGAMLGVAGGGYYWGHYLLQLAPPAAVLAGLALAGRRRLLPGAIAPLLALAVAAPIVQALAPRQLPVTPATAQRDPAAVGELLRLNGTPEDRVAVLYARANVAYFAGMRPATPYLWSSMYRAIPSAREELLAALTGPRRAEWVVVWQRIGSFGMNREGRMSEVVADGYRPYAHVCDHLVLVRDDHPRRDVVVPREQCVRVTPPMVAGGALAVLEPT